MGKNIFDFKGGIFDLDGTLVNSSSVWSDIDQEFLGKRGIKVPDDYYDEISAMNFRQAAIYTNERFSLHENIEDIQKEWYDMAIDHYTNNIETVEGAKEYLEYLKSRNVKIALATASAKELYEPVLKRNGIYGYFDYFASTDMVERGKGFPDIYLLACKNIGLSPEDCVVFEDIIQGVTGAKAGNFTTFARLNPHYKNDYDKIKSQADFCFENYYQIINSVC